jgi:hypothetical protein
VPPQPTLQPTSLEKTVLQKTVLQKTVLQKTALQKTALQKTALKQIPPNAWARVRSLRRFAHGRHPAGA